MTQKKYCPIHFKIVYFQFCFSITGLNKHIFGAKKKHFTVKLCKSLVVQCHQFLANLMNLLPEKERTIEMQDIGKQAYFIFCSTGRFV